MNQPCQTSNLDAKTDSSEHKNSNVPSENSAVQTPDSENVDSNTLAAVLQFLQKHNLKVTRRHIFCLNFDLFCNFLLY